MKYISCKALRMYPHQYVFPISDSTVDESDMRLFVDLILKCVQSKLTILGR